jgi:hypothetical protein
MERRKFARMYINLPMEYQIHLPDSGEFSAGKGVLKNVSQGGMYFKCPSRLALKAGDLADFTIDTTPLMRYTSRLRASGKVVRTEKDSFDFGIAVQFLSNLIVELKS